MERKLIERNINNGVNYESDLLHRGTKEEIQMEINIKKIEK